MNILLLGSGGREHALAWKIAQSEKCEKLFIAPGNAGTASVGENVDIKADDFESLKKFAVDNNIDMIVVGPEDPLVKGVYDNFRDDERTKHIPVIGPSKAGAVLEGSKDFAKRFMKRHNIPTAKYETFDGTTLEEGLKFLETLKAPYVLKADGLCAGKGVLILPTLEEAKKVTEDALQIAENANKSKSYFLSNISHDIRTPMNAIVGLATLLSNEADNPKKVGEYTKKLLTTSQHLLGLINDVLDMSRIESGETTLNLSEESISSIVDELDQIVRPQMRGKGHTFCIDIENIVHDLIIVDKVRLKQICLNLLTNAVKYTQNGGNIKLKMTEYLVSGRSAHYKIEVSDNGYGMDEEFQNNIFDSFTRENDSRISKIQGTGLGMAITKSLVDLMGGTIIIESEKGVGSTFIVDIQFQICRTQDAAQQLEENESGDAAGILKGKKILVAEDNEMNAEIISALLEMYEADFDIYDDGKKVFEAFEVSKPGEYDFILMDVQMPVMNGYEATRSIRACNHENAHSIPIIAMTANAFTEDVQNALSAGMTAHLSKPIDMDALEKTVKEVLSRKDTTI